jgi:hypothetical protein
MCLRNRKHFYRINRINNLEIAKRMGENKGKWKNTCLTHFCDEYEN